ncbi:hypothetical protein EVAR_28992_1 [Eumeta japonica]|uniref:Uncharacterized protein n=1 Tax=Eumeta variegata TaxID=151549 RepID=A0A4C1W4Z3_EUMVA|nr:hypothetical protein EVAR_28992_1 [Eumeta japonica]
MIQDLPHVLKECPIYLKERAEPEADTDVNILRRSFPDLLSGEQNRKISLTFCEGVVRKGCVLNDWILVALRSNWLQQRKRSALSVNYHPLIAYEREVVFFSFVFRSMSEGYGEPIPLHHSTPRYMSSLTPPSDILFLPPRGRQPRSLSRVRREHSEAVRTNENLFPYNEEGALLIEPTILTVGEQMRYVARYERTLNELNAETELDAARHASATSSRSKDEIGTISQRAAGVENRNGTKSRLGIEKKYITRMEIEAKIEMRTDSGTGPGIDRRNKL